MSFFELIRPQSGDKEGVSGGLVLLSTVEERARMSLFELARLLGDDKQEVVAGLII